MATWWDRWGVTVIWVSSTCATLAVSAFLAWHDLKVRITLLESAVVRIERALDTQPAARATWPLQTSATHGQGQD